MSSLTASDWFKNLIGQGPIQVGLFADPQQEAELTRILTEKVEPQYSYIQSRLSERNRLKNLLITASLAEPAKVSAKIRQLEQEIRDSVQGKPLIPDVIPEAKSPPADKKAATMGVASAGMPWGTILLLAGIAGAAFYLGRQAKRTKR